MTILTVRSDGVFRSTFYLKDGGPVPSDGATIPPLRTLLLQDPDSRAELLESKTRAEILDSHARANVRG